MSEIHSFGVEPITSHAFNASKDKLAISPNNNEVHIYHKQSGKWSLNSSLSQHDLRVTSIDWAKNSNRIVTCSADRNAYVWSLTDDGVWKPTLVLLRINRAATCVRWSPKEDKFAVGCGAKLISVCYFEEHNDWWVSKHIKKPIRSTVTTIDWHPNNILLACGSTDFRTRIFSAYIRDVDKKNKEDANTTWGGKPETGSLIGEFLSSQGGGGWVHSVAFSPDGTRLAWVSHDSSISIVDSRKSMHPINVRTRFLPFLSCIWSSNNLIVAAGHDCCPMLYYYDDYSGEIRFIDKVDKSQKKEAGGVSAMRIFRDLDKRAVVEGTVSNTALDTIHQNSISEVRLFSDLDQKLKVDKISSVGVDGQMVIWDLKTLEASLANLQIK